MLSLELVPEKAGLVLIRNCRKDIDFGPILQSLVAPINVIGTTSISKDYSLSKCLKYIL